MFIQDNDPSQNCSSVKRLFKKKKITQLTIPARSPDLNPIENLFNNVKVALRCEALTRNIITETFEEFKDRVISTLYSFPIDTIDNNMFLFQLSSST